MRGAPLLLLALPTAAAVEVPYTWGGAHSIRRRAPWYPATDGVCSDQACCAEQCVANGWAGTAANQTADGVTCVGACLMRAGGTDHADVEERCRRAAAAAAAFRAAVAPEAAGKCQNGGAAGDGADACLAGAAIGAAPPVASPDGAPTVTSPGSFFWDMDSAGPSVEGRGVSWYTRIFALFDEGYPMDNTQMGMGGTWLAAAGLNYDYCPCKPGTFGSDCCKTSDCSCAGWLFESFEGGPGYWGNELPTTVSKWRVGDSVGCYDHYTGSPLFQFGNYGGHDCDRMGIAQISNQMVMSPDGVTFDVEGMLGVAYAHTPLGKTHDGDKRNFWTIVLDAENFAGPLGYFIPEFWTFRKADYPESDGFGDYSTCSALSQGQAGAFEWNTLHSLKASNGDYKLPKMTVPYTDGRTVLMMNHQYFDDDQLSDPLEKALASGKLDPAELLSSTKRRQCGSGQSNAQWGIDGSRKISIGTTHTTVEDGECVWSLKVANSSCGSSGDCDFPRFVDGNLKPMSESSAPAELRSAKFPENTRTGQKYDQLSPKRACVTSPGPVDSQLYCARTLQKRGSASATWLGYKWYKFVDQPGLQQANLTSAEKEYMQQRVETLHKMAGRTSRWLKPGGATKAGLAVVDAAAMTTPPKGMEHGYVPIVLYEGFAKPSGCVAPGPAPPPPPPTPAPPAPPPPPPSPSPSAEGVWLHEKGGSGKLFVAKSAFAANPHRGGALAWDVCGGGSFDNGHPLWTNGVGAFVGSFQVTGGWALRTSTKCGVHYAYDPLPNVGGPYTAADGVTTTDDLDYLEVV